MRNLPSLAHVATQSSCLPSTVQKDTLHLVTEDRHRAEEHMNLSDLFDCLHSSVSAAPQHVWRSELHRHVSDDWLLRLLCCHLPWS